MTDSRHIPVMVEEVLNFLKPTPGGLYLDGTLGSGGHSLAILKATKGHCHVWGVDQDSAAIERAKVTLCNYLGQLELKRCNFKDLPMMLEGQDIRFDGMIFDLGVSLDQLSDPSRGFSFQTSGPLDMRMDKTGELTAAEIVNEWSEEEIADLIYQFGEERHSRRIARRICLERQKNHIETTDHLAQIVQKSIPRRPKHGIHPATRTFQALRIAVNEELAGLGEFLEQIVNWLNVGGTCVVIAFHSLEDRIVKHTFRALAKRPSCFQLLTKKVVKPSATEKERNPKSRSARLRAIRKSEEKVINDTEK